MRKKKLKKSLKAKKNKFDPKKFEEFLEDAIQNDLTKKTLRMMPTDKKLLMVEQWEAKKLEENKCFGVDPEKIKDSVDVQNIGKVPKVLEHLKSELFRKKGIDRVGIFRNAGEEIRMKVLKEKFNRGDFVSIDNANDSATLIKIWFRELPVRIFDFYTASYFRELDENNETEVNRTIIGLPRASQILLDWAMNLMVMVEENSAKNRMTITNLAIVFSPNLYKKIEGNPVDKMMQTSKMSQFFTTLLDLRIREVRGDPTSEEEDDEKIGYLLEDYDYEEVHVKKDEYVTILEDVDEWSYVVTDNGRLECYIPMDYIQRVNPRDLPNYVPKMKKKKKKKKKENSSETTGTTEKEIEEEKEPTKEELEKEEERKERIRAKVEEYRKRKEEKEKKEREEREEYEEKKAEEERIRLEEAELARKEAEEEEARRKEEEERLAKEERIRLEMEEEERKKKEMKEKKKNVIVLDSPMVQSNIIDWEQTGTADLEEISGEEISGEEISGEEIEDGEKKKKKM